MRSNRRFRGEISETHVSDARQILAARSVGSDEKKKKGPRKIDRLEAAWEKPTRPKRQREIPLDLALDAEKASPRARMLDEPFEWSSRGCDTRPENRREKPAGAPPANGVHS